MSDENYIPQHSAESKNIGTVMSSETYDRLKFVAQILLPALGALYFGLSTIWGFPKGEEVVGTITLLDVFLGTILGIASKAYRNSVGGPVMGTLNVEETDEKVHMSLSFGKDPYDIVDQDRVTFKVNRQSPQ